MAALLLVAQLAVLQPKAPVSPLASMLLAVVKTRFAAKMEHRVLEAAAVLRHGTLMTRGRITLELMEY